MTDDIQIIRKALAAGPVPGPWDRGFPKINGDEIREADCLVSTHGCLIASVSHGPMYPAEPHGSRQREVNATYIAACSPDRMERLLAQLEAALKQARRVALEEAAQVCDGVEDANERETGNGRVCAAAIRALAGAPAKENDR